MNRQRLVALATRPFRHQGFLRRAAPVWLGLLVSVGSAIPGPTGVPKTIPLVPQIPVAYAGDPCSSHAGEFPMLTGHLSNSSGTMLSETTTGDVYGRVSNVDDRWQPSPGCGWYRYDAVVWATTNDTTHLTVDWGALSGDALYCNYVLGGTDYLHANSGACPPATTARLVATLSPEATYHNNAALSTKGDFAFAHSDCDTWYGVEPIKTSATTATTSGKPGSNCGSKQLDGTGTSQTLVVDGTPPSLSFAAPAAGGPVVIPAAFYSVVFNATDAVALFGGADDWDLYRQVATWDGSTCGTFATDGSPVSGTTNGTGQISSQSLALGKCYRWKLDATDQNGNTTTNVYSGTIRTDTSDVLGSQPQFRTEGWDVGGGDSLSVSVGSGNLRVDHPIVRLPIRAGSLDLSLSYNSQDTAAPVLGSSAGWRLNVQRRLQVNGDGSVTFTDGDGSRHKFTSPTGSPTVSYTRPATLYATLTRDTAATPDRWTLTYRDQSKDIFDEDITNIGLLKEVRDRFGNTVSIAYTAGTAKISTITDPTPVPNARTIMFTWAGSNLTEIVDWANVSGGIVQISGTGNRTHRLLYDGSNNLIGWADPLNTSATCPTGGSHLTCLTYTSGLLTAIAKTQTYETLTSGTLGTATRTVTTNVTYASADVASVTDAEAAQTVFSHSNASPAGQTKVVRPGTPASETTYTLVSMTDQYGRIGSVKRKLGAAQIETLTSYDATYPVELATITEDNGGAFQRSTNYTYQPSSLALLSRLDEPLDGTYRRYTDYTYNSNNDLTRKNVYSTDAAPDHIDTRYCYGTPTCLTTSNDLFLWKTIDNYVDGAAGGTNGNVEDVTTSFLYGTTPGAPEYQLRIRSTRSNYASGGMLLDSAATGFTYDTNGNLTSEIRNYADGSVAGTGDDVDPNGTTNARTDLTTAYTYDTGGNRVSSADPRRAIEAAIGTCLSADDDISRTTFDALNRVRSSVLPTTPQPSCTPPADPRTATTTYDELGAVREAADINGLATATKHDKVGRALETYETPTYPTAASITASSTYDAHGRILTAKDRRQVASASLGSTQTTYDELGRATAVTDASASSPNVASTTLTSYDALDRVVCQNTGAQGSDPCATSADMGQVTKYTYDVGGRTTKTDDEFTCSTTAYDYRDLAIQTVQGLATATCTGGTPVTTTITNDALGRVTLRSVDVNNAPESNTYDAAGNTLVTSGKQGGVTTTSTRTLNLLDQVIVETRTDGSTAKSNYDAAGNGTDRCYWKPSITVGACLPADTISWTNAPTQAGTSGYDARNNRISLTSRLGSSSTVATTTYDPANNYQVSALYVPTASGKEAQDLYLYGTDGRHRLASVTHQLCTISTGHSCSSTAATGMSTYIYDDNDNRTSVAESSIDWTLTTRNYCYDALNRLRAEKTAASCTPTSGDETYTFDSAGNRLTGTVSGSTRTFTYGADGQLDSCASPSCTVSYYDDGRTKLLTDNGTSWFFVYDADGRLTSACKSTACSGSIDRVDYLYDGSGHRIQIKETTAAGAITTTDFRYQGDTIVQELVGGNVTRTYATDDTGRIIEVCDPDCATGTIYIVVYNGHGDATGLWQVNLSTGALTLANSYTYSTWGVPTTTLAGGFTDLKFRFLYVGTSDVQWDTSFGLNLAYMHARHYSPALGRFLQPDPASTEANLYAYADNSPVSRIDPSGTSSFATWFLCLVRYFAILGRTRELQTRFADIRENRRNLPMYGKFSVQSHRDEFTAKQKDLRRKLESYDRDCRNDGPRPPGACRLWAWDVTPPLPAYDGRWNGKPSNNPYYHFGRQYESPGLPQLPWFIFRPDRAFFPFWFFRLPQFAPLPGVA